jgi:hypothetical protein
MQGGVWLISRELLQAAGLFDVRLTTDDDGEFSCRLLLQSDGVRFVPEARLFYRRSGPNSLSNPVSSKRLETLFLSFRLQVQRLCDFENSGRVRTACVKFLQTSMVTFYPERPDIVEKMHELAASLGGRLELPRFSRRYPWIQTIFGPKATKRAHMAYSRLKDPFVRSYDKTLYALEKRMA